MGLAALTHPWAGVGVLLSPRGVDEPQAGVPRAGGVEEVDQGVAPLCEMCFEGMRAVAKGV